MSLLFNVVFVSRCSSTHHKLAMDALRHVRGEDADRWRDLFLRYHPSYLEGAKAPDNRFKDFKNHVLHVAEGEWGGAIKAVQTWYDRFVYALRDQDWEEAVFSAGVLSHYYTDPLQPFHTGQTEAEGKVHRAAEWSICKCYHEFQNIIEHDLGGYPALELPTTPDWLADHVRNGARASHRYYETCIEHYDLSKGVRHPPSGLDQEMKDAVAELVGIATVGFARLLERGFDESEVQPPQVELLLDTVIAQCRRPVNWIVRQLKDVNERQMVMEIYREVQQRGKAIESLPSDDRTIRRLHAQEVLQIPMGELDAMPARATGSAHGTGEPSRMREREPITRLAKGSRFRFTRGARPVSTATRTATATTTATKATIPQPHVAPAAGTMAAATAASVGGAFVESPSARAPATPPVSPTVLEVRLRPTGYQPAPLRPMTAERDAYADRVPPAPFGGTTFERTARDERVEPASVRTKVDHVRETPADLDLREWDEPPRETRSVPAPSQARSFRPARFYLELTSDIEQAPSIGGKTAERLRAIGLKTVKQLMDAHPEKTAARLNQRWITSEVIRQWQQQSALVCRIPGLRGHDAQILVGCGIIEPDDLATQSLEGLKALVESFCATSAGERVLRGSEIPDEAEIREWIEAAGHARGLAA